MNYLKFYKGFAFLFVLSFFSFALRCALAKDSSIVMQPHQEIPVSYLEKNPDQKGLLLYHSLGSGKTYITLDYAEKSAYQKVIVLLPEFLKSNWLAQMKSFGVLDPGRYELVSFQESERLLNRDLSKTLIVVDEIHKMVQKIRVSDFRTSDQLIQVFEKIKTAGKLLLLTGTPLFMETSDVSYIANLLDQDADYPIDPIKFKTEYMKIKPLTSLVRGHVTESKVMMLGIPFLVTLGAALTLAASAPLAIPFVALAGSALIPVINEVAPVSQVSFLEFDTEKWKDFTKKYVSYYNVKFGENENYPSKEFILSKFEYTDEQTDFFLSFIDEDLSLKQLQTLLEEENVHYSKSYLKIHSSRLQKQLLASTTSGREIGNLDFRDGKNTILESKKFMKILNQLQTQPGQVVVYSNYFANGIKKLSAFLDRHGMENDYVFLLPTDSVEKQSSVVQQYNEGKKRILLVHPDVTEGVSLVGTEHLHILEPIANPTQLDQVIGRTVRYKSHANLPKDRRIVHVYLWEGQIDYGTLGIPTSAGLLRREHWQRKYSEVNPSSWTRGIVDLDSNYFLKGESPDQRVSRRSGEIQKSIGSFRELLEEYSIEKNR